MQPEIDSPVLTRVPTSSSWRESRGSSAAAPAIQRPRSAALPRISVQKLLVEDQEVLELDLLLAAPSALRDLTE